MADPNFSISNPVKTRTWDLNTDANGTFIDGEVDQQYTNENELETAMKEVNDSVPFKNFVEILTSQTWVVPTGIFKLWVEAAGGGGGGGGGAQVGNNRGAGGGGAAGEVRKGLFSVTPAADLVITIGAGGTAGIALSSHGGGGGDTVLATAATMTSKGGGGGISSQLTPTGGLSATGSGGDFGFNKNGLQGNVIDSSVMTVSAFGGGAGSGAAGGQGAMGAGGSGGGRGGGGQGGGFPVGGPVKNGATGGAGYVRIWY